MVKNYFVLCALTPVGLFGCASSDLATTNVSDPAAPLRTVAIARQNPLGQQLGVALMKYGVSIKLDSLVASESELLNPETQRQLRSQGVDAVLFANETGRDAQGHPENIVTSVYSASDGKLVWLFTWENGHGSGLTNSVSNNVMSKNTKEAVSEIAKEIRPHFN